MSKQMLVSSKIDPLCVCLDEAGRGCLLSRVYVGCVVLSLDFVVPPDLVIKDSKKMSPARRAQSAQYIKQHALRWAVGWADEAEVDEFDITGASMNAFHRCLSELERQGGVDPATRRSLAFDKILMDGNYFKPYTSPRTGVQVPFECVPKADSKFLGVSCASILAKTARDDYVLQRLCLWHPELHLRYDIRNNVGYSKPKHREGIAKYGITQFHRRSFKPCDSRHSVNLKWRPLCTILLDDDASQFTSQSSEPAARQRSANNYM